MPPIADPESPPLPPGHDRDWNRSRDRDRDRDRDRSRRRRRLFPVLAALGAAALGAAAAAAALLGMLHWGMLHWGTPPQPPTAAHMLLSAGSLSPPSSPLWRYEQGISGVFLSGDVEARAGVLRVSTAGLYLLYGQLALTCTAPSCPPGTVTLQLRRSGAPRPLLAVPVALRDGPGPVRSALVQAVRRLRAGESLSLALVGDAERGRERGRDEEWGRDAERGRDEEWGRDAERGRERGRDAERGRERGRDEEWGRDAERGRERGRDAERGRERGRDEEWGRDAERGRERGRDAERGRERGRDAEWDRDAERVGDAEWDRDAERVGDAEWVGMRVGGGIGAGWQLAQDEREGNFVGLLRIAGDGGNGAPGGAGRGVMGGEMG